MSSGVTEIGRCKGCYKGPQRLDDGACDNCLTDPKRGRKWVEMSHRLRTDPAFALESFNKIGIRKPEREIAGKLLFIRMYGLPAGAVCPPELQKLVDALSEEDDDEEPRPVLRLVR